MKTVVLLLNLVLIVSLNSVIGQRIGKSEIPNEVKTAFKKIHPNHFPYEWKYVRKKMAYKAYFITDGQKYKSYFKPNGEWMYAKTKIPKEDLPESIWEHYYESEWFDWKLKKTQLRLTPDCGTVYILNVKRGKKSTKEKIKLFYDEEGNFIKHVRK